MTTPAHRPLLAVWLDKLLSTLVILLTGAHAQPLPQLRERTAACGSPLCRATSTMLNTFSAIKRRSGDFSQ